MNRIARTLRRRELLTPVYADVVLGRDSNGAPYFTDRPGTPLTETDRIELGDRVTNHIQQHQ